MRVLKFGGSSLADSDRFLRAADIIANNAQQQEVSVVLSAPGKVTNKLVSVVDNLLTNGEAELQISELESVFTQLFSGISNTLPQVDLKLLENKLKDSISQLRQYAHGITLLGMCPDNVYAKIISKGERISIVMMKAVLEAKGQPASLIDPVKYLYAKGDYLEGAVDVDVSTLNFKNEPICRKVM